MSSLAPKSQDLQNLHGSTMCCLETPESAVGHFQRLLLQLLLVWKLCSFLTNTAQCQASTQVPELCLTQTFLFGSMLLSLKQCAHTCSIFAHRLIATGRWGLYKVYDRVTAKAQQLDLLTSLRWKSGSTVSWGRSMRVLNSSQRALRIL